VTCSHCGFIRDGVGGLSWWTMGQDGRAPELGLPLWLTAECCGGQVLWALNEPHLDYLARFVASANRDRDFPSPSGNRGLAYKLPKWMQVAKHRDEVLHELERLRARL